MTARLTARQLLDRATSETACRQQITATAQRFGWKVMHVEVAKVGQDNRHLTMTVDDGKGWPDLICCRPPRCLAIEVKKELGKVEPEQQAWLDLLEACGFEVMVARPSSLAEVEALLR